MKRLTTRPEDLEVEIIDDDQPIIYVPQRGAVKKVQKNGIPISYILYIFAGAALFGMFGQDIAYLLHVSIVVGLASVVGVMATNWQKNIWAGLFGAAVTIALLTGSNIDDNLMRNLMMFSASVQKLSMVGIAIAAVFLAGILKDR